MSGSLHPTEIHRRRHRAAKRTKLRAQLAASPASGRAAIEAKLQKTYPVGMETPKAGIALTPAAVPVARA